MAKGLDILLNKIRAEPVPTLISRYLSLVDDIADTNEKANLVLQLATLLSKTQPDEALRLAHLVYKLDPHLIGALDIMADAFTAKGRFAKAAVIQLEKEKLERRKAPQPKAVPDGPVAPPAEGPEWRIAGLLGMDVELDLSHPIDLPGLGRGGFVPGPPVEEARDDDAPKVSAPTSPAGGQDFRLTGFEQVDPWVLANSEPKPTVLGDPLIPVFDEAVAPKGIGPTPGFQGPSTDPGRKTPPGGLSRRLLRRLMGKEPGDTILPFSPAAASGATDPPGTNTPPLAFAREHDGGPNHARSAEARAIFPVAELPAKAPPLWQALGEELARLRSRLPLRYVDASAAARIKVLFATHPGGASLSDDFIRALGELDHRLHGSDPVEVLAMKWELFQGLWGAAPTGACADLLKTLGLRHATPPFWGLYLDGLIADRRFQAALNDMRTTLSKHPHLNWARIVAFRLPIVWQGLKVHGFAWSEDDGVAALANALAKRPKPKLAAILGTGFSPKKAGL